MPSSARLARFEHVHTQAVHAVDEARTHAWRQHRGIERSDGRPALGGLHRLQANPRQDRGRRRGGEPSEERSPRERFVCRGRNVCVTRLTHHATIADVRAAEVQFLGASKAERERFRLATRAERGVRARFDNTYNEALDS